MIASTLLDWDSNFFGFPVARIELADLDTAQLTGLLSDLRQQGVRLVYWPARDVPASPEQIAALGGRLVDTKTTFLTDLTALNLIHVDGSVPVESCDVAFPRDALRALAVQSGEYSRFAVDPNIPRAKFEELYMRWIDGSLSREIADEVLVIRDDGRIAGMITLGRKGDRGDIGLLAVDQAYRGRGYGEHLVRQAQAWFLDRGYRWGQVVTQGANMAACRLYTKCGYSVEKTEAYYHFWL